MLFSINTVYYMAPYATMILAFPALILEGPGVLAWIAVQESLVKPCIILFGSGIFAFCLNFSIFYVIKTTTAVTFNVAGNMKVKASASSKASSTLYGKSLKLTSTCWYKLECLQGFKFTGICLCSRKARKAWQYSCALVNLGVFWYYSQQVGGMFLPTIMHCKMF